VARAQGYYGEDNDQKQIHHMLFERRLRILLAGLTRTRWAAASETARRSGLTGWIYLKLN